MNTESTEPKISVCIPVYNGEQFLEYAIASVLNQKFDDYELMLVDDCSTDNSREIIKRFKSQYPYIKYYRNETNLGITRNWNRCIELSRGDYVIILHQDDTLLDNALEKEARVLDEKPEVGVVFGNTKVRYLPSDKIVIYPGWSTPFSLNGYDFARYMLSHVNVIYCPTVMIRRTCLQKYGVFDERFEIFEDYEMWLRLALRDVDFVYLHHPIAMYTYHETNTSRRVIREGNNIKEHHYILESHAGAIKDVFKDHAQELLGNFKQTFGYLCIGYAVNLLYGGFYSASRAQLNAALELYPAYSKHKIVKVLRVLNSLGIVGRLCIIAIEKISRVSGLRKVFEKATYTRALDVPKNISPVDD